MVLLVRVQVASRSAGRSGRVAAPLRTPPPAGPIPRGWAVVRLDDSEPGAQSVRGRAVSCRRGLTRPGMASGEPSSVHGGQGATSLAAHDLVAAIYSSENGVPELSRFSIFFAGRPARRRCDGGRGHRRVRGGHVAGGGIAAGRVCGAPPAGRRPVRRAATRRPGAGPWARCQCAGVALPRRSRA